MTHLRILLVDDHEVVRLGLKSLIERHPGFEVVAEASAAQEARRERHRSVRADNPRASRYEGDYAHLLRRR